MGSPSEFIDCEWLLDKVTDPIEKVDIEELCLNYSILGSPRKIMKNSDLNHINASLCQWYLPTIEQTPVALGPTGIALWVTGFVITFILILLFARQTYFIYQTAHKSFRRHLYFITSIYMVMALFTSIGSGIPRAHAVCSGIKDVYMSMGIGHFMDLTLAMYGGENQMFWQVRNKIINIRVIPLCKCCCCIPMCKIHRRSITVLKWMIWQMKWTQAMYYILKLIRRKSLENSLGMVSFESASFSYLHILNVASFLSGVFSLLVVGSLVHDDLEEKYFYGHKTRLLRLTILTTKLQRLLFEILEACNVFPCYPPYVSKNFYKNVLKDFIYLLEVLILGLLTFFTYCKRGVFERGNSSQVPHHSVENFNENHEQEESGLVGAKDATLVQALNAVGIHESKC